MKSISLVLGSGGARGYAHIGVIRALLENGYEIKSIAGCSMGAVVGGFYAAGKLDEFEQWTRSLSYLDVLKLVDISLLSNGAIRGDKLFNRLSQMLNGIQIQDLNIPFTAVATDLIQQKEIWFTTGALEEAIRASSAIPSLLMPVVKNGRVLVDGAVLNPLPITPVVGTHAEAIIAVDLSAEVPMPGGRSSAEDEEKVAAHKLDKQNWFSQMKLKTLQFFERSGDEEEETERVFSANLGKLGVVYQMFDTMQASLIQYKIAGYRPDLLIRMPKDSIRFHEFYRAEEQIQLGYDIACRALEGFERGESNTYGQL
ncbi:patatin-like phospholipase family protein [Bermanella sp. WJH001]|uniref:patatin-like phospholipase family protein n=1 Tax=Bermanella sp. WJH001 TaxID=3048005 RepID=UPI0024BD8228|nr:patatin-like phospholipase family protein [Bermanella sp. WJH001]MDJ1539516.1 patatin-like phospholipase family protein [Bermanella sp. WJH001]